MNKYEEAGDGKREDVRKTIATAALSAALFSPGPTGSLATSTHSVIKIQTQPIIPPAMSLGRLMRSTTNIDKALDTDAQDIQEAPSASCVLRPYPSPAYIVGP